jgi:succinate dehydrogenase / fumarate reductase iron-sulfur subunit
VSGPMKLKLKVWRQAGPEVPGRFVDYEISGVETDMSFLEMLDALNQDLAARGEDPVAFDHDCREGICGSCGMVIDGQAHGPASRTTACQLHMRRFKDGDTIVIEPFRARAFPPIKDLVVDRSAFDRVIQANGYISVSTGSAPEANFIRVPKENGDLAMDAAECIGCGACVAACKNASAMLFVGAKVSHFAHLPQGQPEREARVLAMVKAMDAEGFGNCTNELECSAACPRGISAENIARLNREFLRASVISRKV